MRAEQRPTLPKLRHRMDPIRADVYSGRVSSGWAAFSKNSFCSLQAFLIGLDCAGGLHDSVNPGIHL